MDFYDVITPVLYYIRKELVIEVSKSAVMPQNFLMLIAEKDIFHRAMLMKRHQIVSGLVGGELRATT